MRSFRFPIVVALLALASTPFVHAAQVGQLTCTSGLQIEVSYFDLSVPNPAAGAKNPSGALTIHAALQQLGTLAPVVGTQLSSCTLTHNALVYTLANVTLNNLDGIGAAASTGGSGSETYVQAIFQVGSFNVSGGDGANDGGDDSGVNRAVGYLATQAASTAASSVSAPIQGGWNQTSNSSDTTLSTPQP